MSVALINPPLPVASSASSVVAPSRRIRVTHISTNDLLGGAARAAHRLHTALPALGLQSTMFVAQRYGADPAILKYNPVAPAPKFLGQAFFKITRHFHRPWKPQGGAYFSFDWTLGGGKLPAQIPPSDLINLHWVSDFLNLRNLPILAARFPIVWTLHDMNTFTGGCHYSGPCGRFAVGIGCGSCPLLERSSGDNDVTRRTFRRKQAVFDSIAADRLSIVTPSRWLANEVSRSPFLGRFDTHVIPNGVDPKEFFPEDKLRARSAINVPQDAKVLLFVADLLDDKRKGFEFLVQAARALEHIPNLIMVTLGRGDTSALKGPAFRHLGSLHENRSVRLAYSAADVFVIPSLQDNLPNTVLEAMACGVPVVGFGVGGISEAVVDGVTGFTVRAADAPALSLRLMEVLENEPLRKAMGTAARARALSEYSLTKQAGLYSELYREMINRPLQGPTDA